jgi:hypothetical protein
MLKWAMKKWNGWGNGMDWSASGSGTWRVLVNAFMNFWVP